MEITVVHISFFLVSSSCGTSREKQNMLNETACGMLIIFVFINSEMVDGVHIRYLDNVRICALLHCVETFGC